MKDIGFIKDNYLVGIDELKIISMFFIVILHILGHGGVIKATDLFSLNYGASTMLESLCLCAVDCYALATGYLLCSRSFKLSRIVKLWCEVEAYSIVVGIGSALITGNADDLTLKQILMSLLPFLSKQYWYFTIYVGVFFLSPYLTLILHKFSRDSLKRMMLTVIFLVCVIPSIINFDLFETPTGSLFWMCFCYIVGGYIAKYQVEIKKPVLLYFLGSLLMWGSRWLYDIMYLTIEDGYNGGVYVTLSSYVSPFCVLSAIGLLGKFKERKIFSKKHSCFIRKISSMSFAVYLIHDNVNFKKYIWYDFFIRYSELNFIDMIIRVIGSAIIVYCICLIFELIRSILMEKPNKLIEKIDKFNYLFEAK